MTELSPSVSAVSELDPWGASCGSLLPRTVVKLVNPEGVEVTGYNEPGELVVRSPSVCLGYFNNSEANAETFIEDADGKWMRTGDEAVFRKAPSGHEHVFIVDRIKELIKVKVRFQTTQSSSLFSDRYHAIRACKLRQPN